MPKLFALPIIDEIKTVVTIVSGFGNSFRVSNTILAGELSLYGGNLEGLVAPDTSQSGKDWIAKLLHEQTYMLETMIYRNAIMARLVVAMGGDLDGVDLIGLEALPVENFGRLTETIKAIGVQLETFNVLEQRRLEALIAMRSSAKTAESGES